MRIILSTPTASHSGRTVLQGAAENGHLQVVERLLMARADVNGKAADWRGMKALKAAKMNGDEKLLKLLMSTSQRS